jgi:hypothetical protein
MIVDIAIKLSKKTCQIQLNQLKPIKPSNPIKTQHEAAPADCDCVLLYEWLSAD